MNKHQIKGSAIETIGKMERKTGTVVSSRKHEIKGGAKELVGKAQRAYGDAKASTEKSRTRDQGRT